jgi:hypothetical protein
MNCKLCSNPTHLYVTDHEIWFGTHDRDISIKYGLQIKLCIQCHKDMHDNKKEGQMKICKKLDLDYDKINFIMNIPEKRWSSLQKRYMQGIKDHMISRWV